MVDAGKIEGVAKVLEDYRKIRVADYQRNFDWSKSELEETWRDLQTALSTGKDHFFGSLILQELDSTSCELVDGQQRVTSLFLFASKLRDELQRLTIKEIPASGENKRDINVRQPVEDFLYGKDVEDTKPRFEPNLIIQKLGFLAYSPLPNPKKDREFPKRSRGEDRAATLAFRNAYWHVKETIESDLQKYSSELDKLRRIHDLSSALLTKLKVLPITTKDSEESLNVFMTTNDRGLPLGVFDIVRGQVLRAVTLNLNEEDKRSKFLETLADWDEILVNVEGARPDQFFRHYLLSGRSEKITMKSLPGVTEKLIDLGTSGYQERAAELWSGTKIAAEVYDQLLRPTAKGKTKDRLEALLLLADSYRVLALRIFHPESGLKPGETEELTRLMMVAVLKWIMANKNAQEFETELQKIAKPLWDGSGYKVARAQAISLIDGFSIDAHTFLGEGVSIQTAKAILFLLESELSGKAASLNYATIHLEHIAPQRATPEWRELLEGNELTYTECISDVGNFTILDEGLNTSTKQAVFSKKQVEYAKSRSNITNDLCSISKWSTEVIEQRRQWIGDSLALILRTDPQPIQHFSAWLEK